MVKNTPIGITSLLKTITQEDIGINDIITLLEQFPVVCVRLVLVANSAWASPKVEVTDVKHACVQLGLKTVKSISIALLVSQQFHIHNCKGFSECKFWIVALIAADLMYLQESKKPTKTSQPSTAHLIGLIHNIGLLAIAEVASEKFSRALFLASNTNTSFSHSLEKTIGLSHLEATQIILSNWGLPEVISNSYFSSVQKSPFYEPLQATLAIIAQLDLDQIPFKLKEDIECDELTQNIIDKSSDYDDLCSIYCR